MSETQTETTPPIPDSDQQQQQLTDDTTTKLSKMSFSIWPPTKRTRDAVTARLIQTLSEKSVLSDRYGTVPEPEASDMARKIEEEAFNSAGDVDDFKAAGKGDEGGDHGLEILQCYSQEISKRMLEFVKARSAGNAEEVKDEVKEEESVADVET
ncbi:WPP domain-containing protein [Artemisia annua]|uniref:WPP domain-containing protein n=1 Tax=Artemisia annua TaxID=35608 RepID=A0A2U1QBU6_ARTAN|nr:WPP domain-containing protein [Artemisia annua]